MRIVIAEDSVLLRDGLTRMLSDGGFEVVAAVPDAAHLLRAVAEHQPDLALIDVRMPPTHTDEGIRAALVIRRQFPAVALLVLSQYVEEAYATDLLSEVTSSEVVAQLLARRRDDPISRLNPPRAAGAETHGRGQLQRRNRGRAQGQLERGGKIRHQHLPEA